MADFNAAARHRNQGKCSDSGRPPGNGRVEGRLSGPAFIRKQRCRVRHRWGIVWQSGYGKHIGYGQYESTKRAIFAGVTFVVQVRRTMVEGRFANGPVGMPVVRKKSVTHFHRPHGQENQEQQTGAPGAKRCFLLQKIAVLRMRMYAMDSKRQNEGNVMKIPMSRKAQELYCALKALLTPASDGAQKSPGFFVENPGRYPVGMVRCAGWLLCYTTDLQVFKKRKNPDTPAHS